MPHRNATAKPRRVLAARLAAAACVLPVAGLLLGATPAQKTPVQNFQADTDRLVMATAHWNNRAQLQKIAGSVQHLIIDQKARTARFEASSDDLARLRRMGIRVDIDDTATQRMRKAEEGMAKALQGDIPGLTSPKRTTSALTASQLTAESSIPGFACYRTVEETYATMDQLAAARPSLASVIDIGPSWDAAHAGGPAGYRMRVLRLTNSATNAAIPDKPNMVVLAAIHAREYTTAELVTRFAEYLANGYGTDPDATWLLDNFRFHFILQGNPDGRKKAESGLSWRKNTDNDDGTCSANAYGVDLNRNFGWRFGQVTDGSSPDPCNVEYRGPGAESENETQNILRYVIGTRGAGGTYSGGIFTDRRTDTGTAPSDFRGMFLDIHSFSQLVLWPWAYTATDAPNAPALQTLGRRLAYFNNYRPVQWNGLYLADGTNTDTVYGTTGAPSYTIELGQEFFEDCSTFESSTYPQNFNALKYAARNLQEPYLSPGGPDTTSMGASAAVVMRGQLFAVSAYVDDGRYNQSNGTEGVQAIASATASLDHAPWNAGTNLAMRASDGAFNASRELVTVNIDTRNLAIGRHVVYVRGTDASGRAGTPSAIYFDVRPFRSAHDFDGDLHSDVVWRNGGTGDNQMWRSANIAANVVLPRVAGALRVVQGDFDGDGKSDLMWRNYSNGQDLIWRSGNSATPMAVTTVTNTAWVVVGVGDFDGDGKSDLFWRNSSTGQDSIWRSANSATQIATATVSDLNWQVVGVGDFDADGRSDVLWRNTRTGANSIWRRGSAASSLSLSGVTNMAWKIVGVGDFDNNGSADIFWRNTSTGVNAIWRAGNINAQQGVSAASTAWKVAAIGDFDADGYADVAWRNVQTGQNGIWKRANSATQLSMGAVGSQSWQMVPYENQP
jgi:hypothetical protein